MDRAPSPLIEAIEAVMPADGQPIVAVLHGFDLTNRPLLRDVPGCGAELLRARTTAALRHADIGREAVVLFERGDRRRPLIVGLIDDAEPASLAPVRTLGPDRVMVSVDGRTSVIEGDREVSLRCGAASITLTRAGKVVIEGTYILSRSSGYNKLKGAAIDIN